MQSTTQFSLLSRLVSEPTIDEIWSEYGSVSRWLQVEGALASAQAQVGVIPRREASQIEDAARTMSSKTDMDRLWRESQNIGYPILPLVNQLASMLPADAAGWVHYGATTQDIMDSALAMQLRDSCEHILGLVNAWGDSLATLAEKHSRTVMPGRTHAQQAVPTTFGAKLAVFVAQLLAERRVLLRVEEEVTVVSLFGAVGTSAATGAPDAVKVRTELARILRLRDTTVPWHVARGGIARYGQALSTLVGVAARFAREIIDLSTTEVGEVHEEMGRFRGASSTMPQKSNPISSEQILGLSISASTSAGALVRAMESGHERASGEWQIEWEVLPRVSALVSRALSLCAVTTTNLQVNGERMRSNLGADSALIMSEAVMMKLAPVVGRGRAHELIYEAATLCRKSGEPLLSAISRLSNVPLSVDQSVLLPESYIGEAEDIVQRAVSDWRMREQKGRANSHVS